MTMRIATLALALGFLAVTAAQARPMYRYVNDEGIAVVAHEVPPEYVAGGYEVLNEKGLLIDVVLPAPDKAKRAELDSEARRAREAAAERKRLQEWDESLLLRYSSVEDIEAARDRSLRDLRIRVSILKGKQRSLRQQVENYQARAADQERRGEPVSEQHMEAIADLRREIEQAEEAVIDRQREINDVVADYERDIERFRSLSDVVELRRELARGDDGAAP